MKIAELLKGLRDFNWRRVDDDDGNDDNDDKLNERQPLEKKLQL